MVWDAKVMLLNVEMKDNAPRCWEGRRDNVMDAVMMSDNMLTC